MHRTRIPYFLLNVEEYFHQTVSHTFFHFFASFFKIHLIHNIVKK